MIGRQEASQHSDCRLEQVHVLVDVEVEAVPDPALGLQELLLQVHDQHRVQAVDQGQAQVEPAGDGEEREERWIEELEGGEVDRGARGRRGG